MKFPRVQNVLYTEENTRSEHTEFYLTSPERGDGVDNVVYKKNTWSNMKVSWKYNAMLITTRRPW
jgi:hypothetical protein